MKIIFQVSFFAICFVFSFPIFGQISTQSPSIQDDEEIIRIGSSLVQTDFIVLDNKGHQVRDLKEADIEIWQDGKPQKITNFSYINNNNSAEKQKLEKNTLPTPPSTARSNLSGRLITFVVDDGNCNSSLIAISSAKDALTKFINEKMQVNDRLAIYQTKGGSSLLQQYTSNKEQLLRTVKKIRYFPPVFGCGGGVFDATKLDQTSKVLNQGRTTFENKQEKESRESGENFNRNNQVLGTIGVLNFIVERLKPVAGRKIIFFLSDGLTLPFGTQAFDAIRGIVDNASRSSVAFNTIDARGLIAPGSSAADEVSPEIGDRLSQITNTQQGLKFLASETGGAYYVNQNRLDVGIEKILDEQSGYYLIAYQPDSETFKNKDFHKIEVRVKNPDFKVLSRAGFYGVEDKPRKTIQKTADSPLFQAIASPLQESGIEVRLTTLYNNDAKKGSFIRALLYLNGQDLTLVDEPTGTKKLSVDVVAVTLDEKNKVVSEFNRTHTVHISKESAARVLQNGWTYTTDLPIEKNGAYSFRIVVRDNATNRLASAGDFIEVLDIKKDKFFMSGLIVAGNGQDGAPDFPTATTAETAISPINIVSNSASRKYSAGDSLNYAYTIYNAKIDNATKKPNLTARIRLFRDGQLVVEGKEQLVSFDNTDLSRIYNRGSIQITSSVQVGEYFLQIIVKDVASKKETSQFIDFEIIK